MDTTTICNAKSPNGMFCELETGHFGEHNAHYAAALCRWTDRNCRFATSIDAIEAFRATDGDMFATASEMEMLRNDPDYRRQVLAGVKVDEYDAEAKADADRLAAEIAELNAAAAIPEGFELVESGGIRAGDIVWNKVDGGFVTYNIDFPTVMAEQCFLVGRPIVVRSTGGGPNGVNAMATGPARVVRELTPICSACGLVEGCHVIDCPNDPDNDPDAGDCPLCMLSNYAHRNNCEYGPGR